MSATCGPRLPCAGLLLKVGNGLAFGRGAEGRWVHRLCDAGASRLPLRGCVACRGSSCGALMQARSCPCNTCVQAKRARVMNTHAQGSGDFGVV